MFNMQNPSDSLVFRVSERGENFQLSPNFQLWEFQCKDGTDLVLVHLGLIWGLEDVRAHFNAPVKVDSGYRTHAHNKNEGGKSESRHLWGMAGDVVVVGVKAAAVQDYADERGFGGIGRYKSFTHLDVEGLGRRW